MAILTHIKENEIPNVIVETIGWRKKYWIKTTEKLIEFIPEYKNLYWELLEYPIKGNKIKLTGRKKRFKNAETS